VTVIWFTDSARRRQHAASRSIRWPRVNAAAEQRGEISCGVRNYTGGITLDGVGLFGQARRSFDTLFACSTADSLAAPDLSGAAPQITTSAPLTNGVTLGMGHYQRES
jgi:hypothetical protein